MKRRINKFICKIRGHKWSTMVRVMKAFEPWPIFCTRCGKKGVADYSDIGWKWYGGYGRVADDFTLRVEKGVEK